MDLRKQRVLEGLQQLVGVEVGERYRLDELLAVGGMGAVFRARHLGLSRDVALKLLRPDLSHNAEVCARLQREARLSSRLDHPNCVRVMDFGTTSEGTRFLAMEMLRGIDLTHELGRPMDAARAVDLIRQALRGLDHAHRRGVLHRDIKPGNIRLVRDDVGHEIVKLCDFGIAKSVGDSQDTIITRVGAIFGTPVYMSPEQAGAGEIDQRSDLYSLGIVMYEMLAGKPPFEQRDPVALLQAKMSESPPPVEPALPTPVQAAMSKLLAVRPDERYQSAAEAMLGFEKAATEVGEPDATKTARWAAKTSQVLDAGLGAPKPVITKNPSSIIRAFDEGLERVLASDTPFAEQQLAPEIEKEPGLEEAIRSIESLDLDSEP